MEANSMDRTSQTSNVCWWFCVPGVKWDHLLGMSVQWLMCQDACEGPQHSVFQVVCVGVCSFYGWRSN